jgi:hypothetical protein
MQATQITFRFVRDFLHTWHQGNLDIGEKLALHCLEPSRTPADRAFRLFGILQSHAENQLQRYRKLYLPAHWQTLETPQLILEDSRATSLELQSWSAIYYRYFHMDGLDNAFIINTACITERRLQRRIQDAIRRLQYYLHQTENEAASKAHNVYLIGQMTLPDHRHLYGVRGLIEDALEQLQHPDAPAFISIEGLGGIGKSALAWEITNRMRQISGTRLKDILWLSAKQEAYDEHGELMPQEAAIESTRDVLNQLVQRLLGMSEEQISYENALPRLATILAQDRYLIVIDNLETLADIDTLLPHLYPLADHARFILTSRISLRHIPYVRSIALSELNAADSKTLLTEETARHSQGRTLTLDDMQRVYDVVGGVPLALRLIAAQLATTPTDTVLEQLRQIDARLPEERHEQMFQYIYRQTWIALREPAQRLLLALVHVSVDGTTFAVLKQRADEMQFAADDFSDALRQLQEHALLEITGSDPHYSLHRLTITFLKTEIIQLRWIA